MDWQSIRQHWQQGGAPPAVEAALAEVRKRESKLHAQVWRRDLLETLCALIVAPFFAYVAVRYGLKAQWLPAGWAGLLAVWAAWVPLRLWRARRLRPRPDPTRPLREYLQAERAALLEQARMLEAIWLWYLAPCAIGVLGLTFSSGPITPGKWIYAAIVIAFCVLIGWANRYAARTQFRAQADLIQTRLTQLSEEQDP